MKAEITVEAEGIEPRRYVIRPGQRFEIGRSKGSVLLIEDDSVSRSHAQLELRPDGSVWVADLNSRNGTFLGTRRLEPYHPQEHCEGEPIGVGRFRLYVRLVGEAPGVTRLHKLDQLDLETAHFPEDELKVLGILGRGANGIVFAAHQLLMDRRVAVKCLDRAVDAATAQRFLVEGRTACRVRSPYVVEVYDFRVQDGRIYMVMELVQGMSLLDQLSSGPLTIPRALQIGAEVAEGLTAVHLEGVIHRDVKPSNILIGPSGSTKLGDFGIAKDMKLGAGLTPTGKGIGSLGYVAPEQAASARDVDERADIYALGATLYHALAGHPPQGYGRRQSITEMFQTPVTPLQQIRPDCPLPVASLIARMLDRDPERRPCSAQLVQAELLQLRERCYGEHETLVARQEDARTTQTQRTKAVPPHLARRLPRPAEQARGRGER